MSGNPKWVTEGEYIQSTAVTLTDAQIKTLPTTSVQLIPSSTGQVILILAGCAKLSWNANYTGIDPAAVMIPIYSGGGNAFGGLSEANSDVSALLALGSNSTAIFGSFGIRATSNFGINLGFAIGPDDTASQGINLAFDNGMGSNLTGGHALNTLKVTIYYVTVTL